MNIILALIILVLVVFLVTIFFGAPYVPTLNRNLDALFDELDLDQKDVLIDIGAGDGRLLKKAHSRGVRSVGYEINPILYLVAKLKLVRCPDAQIKFGSYHRADLSDASVVYVFTSKIHRTKIHELLRGFEGTIVSNGFELDIGSRPKIMSSFLIYEQN